MTRKRKNLDDLLAECDPHAPMPDELVDWEDAPAVGREPRMLANGRRLVLPFREADLLTGLTGYTAHADEAATLMPCETDPQHTLKGTVLRYVDPMEPASDAEDWEALSPDAGDSPVNKRRC